MKIHLNPFFSIPLSPFMCLCVCSALDTSEITADRGAINLPGNVTDEENGRETMSESPCLF